MYLRLFNRPDDRVVEKFVSRRPLHDVTDQFPFTVNVDMDGGFRRFAAVNHMS